MSALTRRRCSLEGYPNENVKLYYTQRASSVGIIATECMPVNDSCCAWRNAGALYMEESIPLWKEITDSVHNQKCYIFAQLFHGGRTVHPFFGKNKIPFAPSPIRLPGDRHTPEGDNVHAIPKEMTIEDIESVKEDFKKSIRNASKAGFDGIEFHSANGYLLDEFLRTETNKRLDVYGGSIENRCRLLLELIDIAISIVGSNSVGVKLTPVGRMNSMFDDNPEKLLDYLLPQLDIKGILYVTLGSPENYITDNNGSLQMKNVVYKAKQLFKNGIVICDGYDPVEERFRRIEDGEADIANFGKLLIANPNLPHQLLMNLKLNPLNNEFLYSGGLEGYCDYPVIN